MAHILPNNQEKPIAYASRGLSSAEKNYSQIEREGLAIIFALCKFHQYLYGRTFILCTDSKPLMTIFSPKKCIPQFSANRLKRWSVILAGYNYTVQYVKSENNCADFLSRLPIQNDEHWEGVDINYSNYYTANNVMNFSTIQYNVRKDKVLCKIMMFEKNGWPEYSKLILDLKVIFLFEMS